MSIRPVIKSRSVHLEKRAAIDPEELAPTPPPEKQVRLIEVEGQVHGLELKCTCGEESVIRLEYPAEEQNAPEE